MKNIPYLFTLFLASLVFSCLLNDLREIKIIR